MKLIIAIFLTLLPFCVSAQQHSHGETAKPVTLMEGLGNHHHPIATKNEEAQKYFDQGLILVFGFNHAEAIRSFERAAKLDPTAAMPLWGIALALGPNYNLDVDPAAEKAAYDAVQKALAVAPKAPENERAYIEALAKRYSNDPTPDLKKLSLDYKNAMGELTKKYPDDLDAATLYAESAMNLRPWQLWEKDGKPAEGTDEILSVLESVLRRDPLHPGANHYYIHAVEASPNPERALPSAARLDTLVPAAGHLVHMPAHIHIRTGDYEAAALSNERAAKADEKYIEATQTKGVYPMMYYNHNLHFYSAASAMQGRFDDSIKWANKLAANVAPAVKEMPMIEGFLPYPYFVLLRFNHYKEVMALPEPDKSLPITTSAWHYARGVALAGSGKSEEGAIQLALLVETRKKIPADALFGLNKAQDIMALASHVLKARIAESRNQKKEAFEHWKKAVAAEDALTYDEPPDWYYPTRESLGGALYRDGQFAAAEEVFREDLKHHPRNGRSLFGLLQSLKAQKEDSDAAWVERQFKKAWKNAEVTLKMEEL